MSAGRDLVPTAPVHTEVWADEHYEGIDRGIVFAVRILHAHGIPTCQSCQGGEDHAYRYPSIDMQEGRAFEAMEHLESYGIEVRSVSTIWDIRDGVPAQRVWRVELRADVLGRADERPMFVAGHLHRDCWRDPVAAEVTPA